MEKKNILALMVLIFSAFAAEASFKVGSLYYNKNDDGTTVTVTYYRNPFYTTTSYHRVRSAYTSLNGDLVIPDSIVYSKNTYKVTAIGENAFFLCENITSVTIGENVTSIGNGAFGYCTGLTSATIGESVTTIDGSGVYHDDYNNYYYNLGAFSSCTNLGAIEIPSSVTTIGDNAFRGCSSITGNLTIPDNVTAIGQYAFSGCSNITGNLTIPDNVTAIGQYAFNNCSGIKSLSVGTGTAQIDYTSFSGCSGLTSVAWNAKKCADYNTKVNTSNSCFNWAANSIKEFTFGDEVEEVPSFLCHRLNGITTITLPSSIYKMGYRSMAISSLTELVSLRERPAMIEKYSETNDLEQMWYDTFADVPTSGCDLHVVKGSQDRYKSQPGWKEFFYVIEDAEDFSGHTGSGTGIAGDVNGDGVVSGADVTALYELLLGQ